jgi:hypothetical protein
LPELLERLEEARLLAMASGQATAAVAATMAEAKLCGFVIDKSQSAVAVAGAFSISGAKNRGEPESIGDLIENMREDLGLRGAERFIHLLRGMGIEFGDDDPVEARRLADGTADGAGHD